MYLLGTPNGVGAAYILVQHKETLGNLKISKITVFEHTGMYPKYPCMLFHVEYVPKARGIP